MLNNITIMGRLTRDPEIRRTQSGTAVASFSIACERDFGNNGERETDFFDCVAWKGTADFIGKYFTKGSMIVINGRLQSRSWTDKDGRNRRAVEILANNVYFGESKKPSETNTQPYSAPSYATPSRSAPESDFATIEEDDAQLPF